MNIDYLITVETKDSLCTDIQGFKNLLKANSSISITNRTIVYRKENVVVRANYTLKYNKISADEIFFYLKLKFESDDDTREIRELIHKLKNNIIPRINPNKTKLDIIWNDIETKYSIQSYPIINNVENLMRKLIILFMTINVGKEWTIKNLSNSISQKVAKNELKTNDIYKIDFIQINDVLFKKYADLDVGNNLRNVVKKIDSNELVDKTEIINELSPFIPKSNWERYFENKVDYSGIELSKAWKKLYDLRNKVAHNRGINKSDFEDIKTISGKITKAISNAIKNVFEIQLTDDEKLNVVVNIGSELNRLNAKYRVTSPKNSVPIMKLLKYHKPTSEHELCLLIENHITEKCECGVKSKGTVEDFGKTLFEKQIDEWGEYKFSLEDCIKFEYDLFIRQTLRHSKNVVYK